jgi:hypothetical protein
MRQLVDGRRRRRVGLGRQRGRRRGRQWNRRKRRGSSGAVTFSCYETGELCTQILVQPSGVAAEQQTCAGPLEDGVSGTGCPTAGLLGCCQSPATDPSHEEQCYYDAASLTIAMQLCASMTGHTWSSTI